MPETKYLTVYLRVSSFEFSKFKEASKKKISGRKIIEALCKNGSGVEITVFDKNNEKSITLPKNFLCKK